MATADDPEEDPPDGPDDVDRPETPLEDVEERVEPTTLPELPYVGDATAEVLAGAEITVGDVRDRAVSYRQLVEAGVNPGVAGKIRREHSLRWTHDDTAFDLDRRSKGVRGLRDGERAWVASTAAGDDPSEDAVDEPAGGGDWTPERTGGSDGDAGSGDAANARLATRSRADADEQDPFDAEAAWRERARSPAVATMDRIPPEAIDRLEAVGVATVRQLATADPERLAAELGVARDLVATWIGVARDRTE